ncbi:MAG TPA: alpha/beta hydrolase family protein [Terriglobales bacterium]|nr:alpha/beta hydrolase family protein [Terriglobales bacterium]
MLLLLLGCVGCSRQAQPLGVQSYDNGTLTVWNVRTASPSVGVLSYRALVPKVGPEQRLPVLYLLHGANSSPDELMSRSDVSHLAVAANLIVVMPEAGLSYYTNAAHKRHARWEDAIAVDLPRDVDSRLPVLRDRAHTGIAGISMGGYGAIKLALKYPDRYAFTASLSGALDITRRRASLKRWQQTMRIWEIFGGSAAAKTEDVFLLLPQDSHVHETQWFESCGEKDPLFAVNQRFATRLRQRGASVNFVTTPGGHDWQDWNAALPQMFQAAQKTLQ